MVHGRVPLGADSNASMTIVPSRIVDIDVNAIPQALETEPECGLFVVAWCEDVPVGTLSVAAGESPATLQAWLRALARTPPLPRPSSLHSGSLPTVSAVVCTRNRPQALRRCLQALRQQSYSRAEIIVIDNGDEEETATVAREYGARYVLEARPGVRFARNRAVREARGEVIAFTDDDCEPHPRWLASLAEEFATHPRLGCCTGPVLPSELQTPSQELMERRGGFSRGFERRLFTESSDAHRLPSYPLQAWMFGTGGNMAFRRNVLELLNGFDDVLPTAEDLDIFYRVLHAGFELLYEPAAVVRHRHVRGYRVLRKRLYWWGWGYVGFLVKVAIEEPRYRFRAIREIGHWFYLFQMQRLFAARTFPFDLITAELMGGTAALFAYPLRRAVQAVHRGKSMP